MECITLDIGSDFENEEEFKQRSKIVVFDYSSGEEEENKETKKQKETRETNKTQEIKSAKPSTSTAAKRIAPIFKTQRLGLSNDVPDK